MIQITVEGRRASVADKELLTSGSAGIQVQFTLDSVWETAPSRYAVFRVGDDGLKVDIPLDNSLTCEVPPEVLETAEEVVFIGVYGARSDGTVIIPTIWASAGVVRPGVEPATPRDYQPTPSVVDNILEIANRAEQTATDAMSMVEEGLQDLSDLEGDVETAEAQRQTNEQARVTTEGQRATAENVRTTAETGRVDAESARVTSEQGRVAAEESRIAAENARVSAEASRVTAEEGRVAAEAYREEKYAEYVTTVQGYADAASASATAAAGSATSAAGSASAASTSAGQASSSATAASTSASQASNSASSASTSATTASNAATTATTQAGIATTKAGEAASSATAASGSATAAGNAQTAAEAAQAAAEEAAESIEESAAQIAQNTQDISDAKNAIDTKAPVIINTASGDIATFDDGADGMPIKHLIANIEAVQSGTGDPSPENIRPITGWTGLTGARNGVNQWDEDWEVGGIGNNGQNNTSTNRIRSKGYIGVVGGETYYTTGRIAWFEYDANKAFLREGNGGDFVGANASFTPSVDAYFIRFICTTTYGTTYNNDISINYPSTDTAYHAYQGDTISVSWATEAGTVYGGTLDVVSGELTVTHAKKHLVASDFTSYFDTYKQASGSNLLADAPAYYDFTAATYYCDMFKPVSNQSRADDIGNYAVLLSNGLSVGFSADVSSLDEFQALIPNGMDFVYRLATPVVYHLDPVTVNTLLGNNTVYVDCGGVTVDYPVDTGIEVTQLSNAISQKQDATTYVTLSGTIVTQTGADNTMYLCGELAELTFTAPATGITAVRFTSGTTPTVVTLNGITMPDDWTGAEASTTYEINVLNGLGVWQSWI